MIRYTQRLVTRRTMAMSLKGLAEAWEMKILRPVREKAVEIGVGVERKLRHTAEDLDRRVKENQPDTPAVPSQSVEEKLSGGFWRSVEGVFGMADKIVGVSSAETLGETSPMDKPLTDDKDTTAVPPITRKLHYFRTKTPEEMQKTREAALAVKSESEISKQILDIKSKIYQSDVGKKFSMYVGDGDDVLYDVRLKEQIKNGDDVGSKVARGVGTVVGGVGKVFGESSQARALKAIKKEDPTFSTKVFLNELERVVIPTVLKAYSAGDMATLRQFTTGNGGDDVQMSSLEKAYADLVGNLKELEAMGLHVEGNILDIREVDISGGGFHYGSPFLVASFVAQQTTVAKNNQGDVKQGAQTVYYKWGLQRDVDHVGDSSWKVVELAIEAMHSSW